MHLTRHFKVIYDSDPETLKLRMQQRICYFIKISRRSIERVTAHAYVQAVIGSFGSS